MKSLAATLIAGFAYAVSGGAASAQISDDVVKIGVLTDMSSLYAHATGKGSLAAIHVLRCRDEARRGCPRQARA
jgi:branched-chain amino acid transport system substrate-binding protein